MPNLRQGKLIGYKQKKCCDLWLYSSLKPKTFSDKCEQVLETAHQVGRLSVSTASDVPYKEMSHHCEALLMGKQQKMSYLMNNQQRQESLLIRVSQHSDENDRGMVSHVHTDISLKLVISFSSSLVQHRLISFACSLVGVII